ncbi:glycosyltransferase [Propionicicella superfundia]|uniref:glycosyltransferase n=1 Tax=Propionicicella superfundia TaxID=348582 RepID=UPI0004134F9F|nr:glycosyltransferase [Propionicicella superfundia]
MNPPVAPLRVAFVSLHTSPLADPGQGDAGGMNVVERHVALALARAGHTVDIFTRRSDPTAADVIEVTERVRLVHLTAGPAAPLAKSAMEQAIEPFGRALEQTMAGSRPYDIVHSHHWFSGVSALPVARRHGVPHVQSFHSVAAPAGAVSPAAGETAESAGRIAGERLTAVGSDLVVAVSDAEAATVRERYAVPAGRIAIARPGVDVAGFHPVADGEDPPAATPYLLFAARLQPLKGPDLALDVLAALAPAHPDLGLILTGAASQDFRGYADELRERAQRLGIADRTEFVGPRTRSRLAALMRHAEVFLLPSWSETFGLVALESQASGVPVVGWRHAGGLAEAVAPDGGILLDSREPGEWAAAVAGLLADPSARASLGAGARRFALDHTWETTAAALVGAYARVVRR